MRKLFVGENNEVADMNTIRELYDIAMSENMTEADSFETYLQNVTTGGGYYAELVNKDVLQIAEALELDNDQIAELIERIETEDDEDFELAGARIIHADFIDGIQQEELLSDLYCLGCFNASFLADYLPLDTEEIEAIQTSGAYEAIGKIAARYIKEIQAGYVAADGYGHHFNGYDFSEVETDHYYIFPRAAE